MINTVSTLVTVFLDDSKTPGPEGFVRMDEYAVNPPAGKLSWIRGQKQTLTENEGGVVPTGSCLLGVCARRSDLQLASVVSFYRAPGKPGQKESPFAAPDTRRAESLPDPILLENSGPDGKDAYFYPILSEAFVNKGDYFYTLCVRVKGTEKFYICDPEMEIGPYAVGDEG
jgi:hypothetical protein